MNECRNSAVSHLDALHARVKGAGGGSAGTARVLFELGSELDAAEDERNQGSDAEDQESDDGDDAASVFEQFFQTENDRTQPVFRNSRA
jgi:hypothetical protein